MERDYDRSLDRVEQLLDLSDKARSQTALAGAKPTFPSPFTDRMSTIGAADQIIRDDDKDWEIGRRRPAASMCGFTV